MPDPISATTPTLQTTAKESRHDTFKSWEIKPHTQYDHVTDEKKNKDKINVCVCVYVCTYLCVYTCVCVPATQHQYFLAKKQDSHIYHNRKQKHDQYLNP